MSNATTNSKTISGVAYISLQADIASREGAISATLAHLFFQCACVTGLRTVEAWDALVNTARSEQVSVQDAVDFGE